jgi:aquaporin Z
MMRKYLAEMIGTFAIVFCGTGAIIVNQESGGVITHAGIAVTFGLIVAAMIYTLGEISGAHFNPAVTFGFWLARLFPAKEIVPYVFSQITGAFLASFILQLLFPANQLLGTTLPSGSGWQAGIMEIILTFFLMLTILHVAKGSNEQGMFAGLAIGSVVLLEAMFAGPVSGASMNPARSVGPAFVSGHTHYLWVYVLAPIVGSVIAVFTWRILKENSFHEKSPDGVSGLKK